MKNFIQYNTETGRITQIVYGGDPNTYVDRMPWGERDKILEVPDGIVPSLYDRVDPKTRRIYTPSVNPCDLTELLRATKESESIFNKKLSDYLFTMGIEESPNVWVKNNYHILRNSTYPPLEDFIDAQVKLKSNDPADVSKGQTQLKNYYNQCQAVKARFPKPEIE